MEKGYSVVQASELLGVQARTIRSWIHKGKLQAKKLTGTRRWVILESEIERMRHGNTTTEYTD